MELDRTNLCNTRLGRTILLNMGLGRTIWRTYTRKQADERHMVSDTAQIRTKHRRLYFRLWEYGS